jgi:hypothetical protein
MRQFAEVSISPWRLPYGANPQNATGARQSYSMSPTPPQPVYRRVVLPPPPIFYHPDVEQVVDDSSEDDADAGMYKLKETGHETN